MRLGKYEELLSLHLHSLLDQFVFDRPQCGSSYFLSHLLKDSVITVVYTY